MALAGFAELTLEARDRAALEEFYTDAFGLDVLQRDHDRTWLAAGRNARLGLWMPGEKEFGDEGGRSAYVEDPEGNVVEVWDFFHQGEGAKTGTEALQKE